MIEVDVWDTDEEIKTQNREYVERARSRRWSPVILNFEIYARASLISTFVRFSKYTT